MTGDGPIRPAGGEVVGQFLLIARDRPDVDQFDQGLGEGHTGHLVGAQRLLERGLLVGGCGPVADDEGARNLVCPGGELLGARTGYDHRSGRDPPSVLDRLIAGDVHDRGGRGDGHVGPEDRPLLHQHTFNQDAAAPDERPVLDHHRPGGGRFEDTADADPSREVDAAPDLGARADRGPGVDHGPASHPGADVDETGHHDHPRLAERTVSDHPRRNHTDPGGRQVFLRGDPVVPFERPDLHRLHGTQPEVEEDRPLHPLVDHPVGAGLLGDPDIAGVERGDGLLHR